MLPLKKLLKSFTFWGSILFTIGSIIFQIVTVAVFVSEQNWINLLLIIGTFLYLISSIFFFLDALCPSKNLNQTLNV